jgi:hypothetical protein
MDAANLFAGAGKIAGLGGMSIALIVLLLRPVIAPNVLQGLAVPARERVLRLVVISAFLVGLAGLASYTFSVWLQSTAKQAGGLSVGGNAIVGGNADIRDSTQVGKDLSVGNDLRVEPPDKKQ